MFYFAIKKLQKKSVVFCGCQKEPSLLTKNNLVPKELTRNQINFVYAEEADVLNMALFGMTANELICLSNLENLNSVFINEGLKQSERLKKLNKIAISQMQILNDTDIKYLK